MAERLDCVVVGAGVVGLATARSLALSGREVVVLESESQIGMHTSSRNSEVIHAGLYYPEGSLKAQLCVQGKHMLYDYCEAHHVGCKRLGKLIVAAQPDDLTRLESIRKQAAKNGVDDIAYLDAEQVCAIEPEVACTGALLSPSTGIVDTHELMTSLQGEVEANGGAVILNSEVHKLASSSCGLQFESDGNLYECDTLVNSAGLRAAELIHPLGPVPAVHYAKGCYYAYSGKSPFRHLIYPLPIDGGLGVHATNDLGGSARFGPDVDWVDVIDYAFDEDRKADFVESIRHYYPGIDESRLTPSYTGIRSKLAGPGGRFADFKIEFERDHGEPGLVNLLGIDSPGLTASLAIGDFVRDGT
jgi:L-2-hydroxyglutarate oxidase LhgO